MKSIYLSVTVTRYTDSDYGYGYLYQEGDKMVTRVPLTEGLRAMRRLEKLLGQVATMEINPYDRTIVKHTIHGYAKM